MTLYRRPPHNPRLKEHAQDLRKAGNLSKVLLWEQIKARKLKGLLFHRQKVIGNYIADFYCAKNKPLLKLTAKVIMKRLSMI